MAMQAPRFGRQSAPRKKWAPAEGVVDRRKRGRAGQRDRAAVLAEEPLCRRCLKLGRTEPAVEVDHIIRLADGGTDDRSNKQGLCKPCHDLKTQAELARDRVDRLDLR
ncbi:HNH endonuclease signature motif containing protein [Sphingomonas melonis]|uniref:5-methylcytosine-specific restriction protein A n=1 Tax=Sphingomonas melonis TaxID=152682 RepID=A0A7Y9FQP1_9SPHN|nr:HNH endonuclease signature motif containing protein [Sphingomonas melonis]NYD91407.1 5-methylcytosine-specific restriction protein A [Sphingomonas melonis]